LPRQVVGLSGGDVAAAVDLIENCVSALVSYAVHQPVPHGHSEPGPRVPQIPLLLRFLLQSRVKMEVLDIQYYLSKLEAILLGDPDMIVVSWNGLHGRRWRHRCA